MRKKRMNSIVLKLGLTMISLLLVVMFPLGYVVDKIFTNFYYEKTIQSIDTQSNKIVQFITEAKEPEMASNVIMAMKMTNYGVALLDSSKRVVTRSNTTLNIEKFLGEDDWNTLKKGVPVADHWQSQNIIIEGKPIFYNGHFNGAVLMATSTEDMKASMAQMRSVLFLSSVGAILLGLGLTLILVRKLSVPLLKMEQATRRIAEGELTVRVEHSSRDELGSLAVAINDLASSLKRYEDTRKEFFVNISHELRTPLTYIEGYMHVLEEKALPVEERNKIQDIIITETNRLKSLVDDLFDLSKMEEGKMALTLEWIDLSEVIENATENVRIRAKKKNTDLRLTEERIPLLYLDGYRMQQVFINLLDNAIRYTENGTISIHIQRNIKEVIIRIEDTGIGIPEEEIPFIFERFHRVEKSRSREYGGSGLGLAIVKKLVELQGGTIRVESVLGAGTTFILKFSVSSEEKMI